MPFGAGGFGTVGYQSEVRSLGDGVQDLLSSLKFFGSPYAGGTSHDVRIEPDRGYAFSAGGGGPRVGLPPPSGAGSWVKDNWLPLGIVAAVVVVAIIAR